MRYQMTIEDTASYFVRSGMFPDLKSEEQAATKLIIGRGFGLSDYDSVTGLYLRQGKVNMHANVMASAIKASGKYDYEVLVNTDQECQVQFYRVAPGVREPIGTHTFSMEQAQRANLTKNFTWKQYPEAMLFARCISAGYRAHCPDALGAAPVYVEQHGELEGDGPEAAPPPAQRAVPEAPSTTVDDDVDAAEEKAIREEQNMSVRATIVQQIEGWAGVPREEAVKLALTLLDHMNLPTDGTADDMDLGIILAWILDCRREGLDFDVAVNDRIQSLTEENTKEEEIDF